MKMARMETAMRTVIDFNMAFNRRDIPVLLTLVSEGCVFENPDPCSEAAIYTGRDELASFWDRFFSTYSQTHLEIEEIFGFSIHCVMRWRFDYVDISGTGCRLNGVDLFLVRNLLIAEKLSYLKK